MEYFIILIAVFIIHFIIKKAYNIRLFLDIREGLLLAGIYFLIGIVLETLALRRGYWSYSERYLTGINIGLIPLEEFLFYLIVPYSIIVWYKLVSSKFGRKM